MAKKKRKNIKKHDDQQNEKVSFMENLEASNENKDSQENTIEQNEQDLKLENTQNGNIDTNSQERPSEVKDESIGIYLRRKREEKGVSLKNISQATKIGLSKLESLENDNFDKLPDKVYVIGYVKNYAKILNLDSDYCISLLNQLYKETPSNEHLEMLSSSEERPIREEKLPIKIIALTIAGISTACLISYAVFSTIKDYQEEIKKQQIVDNSVRPQTINAETPLSPNQNESEELSTDEGSAENAELSDTLDKNLEEKKQVLVKKVEEAIQEKKEEKIEVAREEKKVVKKEKDEKIKFYAVPKNLYSIDTSINKEESISQIPESFRNSLIENTQNVFITATNGDSWLTYKSDDEPIKKFILKKGRSILIRGDLTRVFLGNLNAVKIFLNNQVLKVSSRTGVKSIIFPESRAEEFKLPLFIYKKDGTVLTSDEYIEQNSEN